MFFLILLVIQWIHEGVHNKQTSFVHSFDPIPSEVLRTAGVTHYSYTPSGMCHSRTLPLVAAGAAAGALLNVLPSTLGRCLAGGPGTCRMLAPVVMSSPKPSECANA